MKKNIILLFFLFCSFNFLFCQFKVGGYFDKNFKPILAVNYSINKKFNTELRYLTSNSGNFETLINYNFLVKNYYQLGVGAGVNFKPFHSGDFIKGFFFPLTIEITPFKKYSFFSFSFEPSLVSYLEKDLGVRGLLGFKIRL